MDSVIARTNVKIYLTFYQYFLYIYIYFYEIKKLYLKINLKHYFCLLKNQDSSWLGGLKESPAKSDWKSLTYGYIFKAVKGSFVIQDMHPSFGCLLLKSLTTSCFFLPNIYIYIFFTFVMISFNNNFLYQFQGFNNLK